jgi:hypothetical protein
MSKEISYAVIRVFKDEKGWAVSSAVNYTEGPIIPGALEANQFISQAEAVYYVRLWLQTQTGLPLGNLFYGYNAGYDISENADLEIEIDFPKGFNPRINMRAVGFNPAIPVDLLQLMNDVVGA